MFWVGEFFRDRKIWQEKVRSWKFRIFRRKIAFYVGRTKTKCLLSKDGGSGSFSGVEKNRSDGPGVWEKTTPARNLCWVHILALRKSHEVGHNHANRQALWLSMVSSWIWGGRYVKTASHCCTNSKILTY